MNEVTLTLVYLDREKELTVKATNYADAIMEALRQSNEGRAERLSGTPFSDFPVGAVVELADGESAQFEIDWQPQPRLATRDIYG
jgi:hypothetical protein